MIEYMEVGDHASFIKYPCRINDLFYRAEYLKGEYKIVEYKVTGFGLEEYSASIDLSPTGSDGEFFSTGVTDIGDRIFRTAEEAEKNIEEGCYD